MVPRITVDRTTIENYLTGNGQYGDLKIYKEVLYHLFGHILGVYPLIHRPKNIGSLWILKGILSSSPESMPVQ